MNSNKPVDPQAAAVIARVRRLMLIASLTTLIAIGAVFAAIGYRVFHRQESRPAIAPEPALPAGAKILSSAVGDGHIVLTVESDGTIEMLSFDLATLKPLGRVRLSAPR